MAPIGMEKKEDVSGKKCGDRQMIPPAPTGRPSFSSN